MRVEVDREVCAGAGMCALAAPAVFSQDETDGRVVLSKPGCPAEHEAAAREAAVLCPSGAISIRP